MLRDQIRDGIDAAASTRIPASVRIRDFRIMIVYRMQQEMDIVAVNHGEENNPNLSNGTENAVPEEFPVKNRVWRLVISFRSFSQFSFSDRGKSMIHPEALRLYAFLQTFLQVLFCLLR